MSRPSRTCERGRQEPVEPAALARYCTACGRVLDAAGHCVLGHGAPSASAAPAERLQSAALVPAPDPESQSGSPKRGWAWRRPLVGVAVVAVVAVAGWAILDARSNNRNLRNELARDNRAATQQSHDLTARVHTLQAAVDATAARLSALTRKPDATAIASETLRSVFTVDTTADLGTGWVIRSGASGSDLITNYHVVADDYEDGIRSVRLTRGDESYPATVTEVDVDNDLAVIHTSQRFAALHTSTTTPAIGETVYAVGSPLGLDGTVSAGIVSASRVEDGRHLVQFSAPISPGNSGGPVVRADGAVIGVSELKVVASGAEGLSFAIPTSTVCATFAVC